MKTSLLSPRLLLVFAALLPQSLLAEGTGAHANDYEAGPDAGPAEELIAAVAAGNEAIVEALLADGALLVNAKDEWGWTALHEASNNGNVAIMEVLLAKETDVDVKDEFGQTPLHRASINGDAAAVELLLAAGADVGAKDEDGQTPRDVAASFFNTAVIEALDRALANPQAPGDRADEEGGQEDVHFPSALDAQREVAGWLRGLLPKLGKADAVRYRDHLIENGFDSTEAMALLEQDDLPFMKEGHKRLVAKQLVESQEILLRHLLNL